MLRWSSDFAPLHRACLPLAIVTGDQVVRVVHLFAFQPFLKTNDVCKVPEWLKCEEMDDELHAGTLQRSFVFVRFMGSFQNSLLVAWPWSLLSSPHLRLPGRAIRRCFSPGHDKQNLTNKVTVTSRFLTNPSRLQGICLLHI